MQDFLAFVNTLLFQFFTGQSAKRRKEVQQKFLIFCFFERRRFGIPAFKRCFGVLPAVMDALIYLIFSLKLNCFYR